MFPLDHNLREQPARMVLAYADRLPIGAVIAEIDRLLLTDPFAWDMLANRRILTQRALLEYGMERENAHSQ